MEQTLTIIKGKNEISFSDLDSDNEIEVEIDNGDSFIRAYLNKENLISLKKHISYILDKIDE